ncbi:MAG TPA: hypothetical protein VNL77_03025 [Roseiflexaceae bacterium]|nr:hypothetical protein [Roseiflexaceae bacterium]
MSRRAEHLWLAALLLLAFAHGAAYALLVPLWQAPDEPLLFEYAALTAELGRVPDASDRSPALEARILDSLGENDFWRYTIGSPPAHPPRSFAESDALFWMPRQVGGDPPAYFVAAALPLRLLAGWRVTDQARLLRLLNVVLLVLLALCAYGAARELEAGAGRNPAASLGLGAAEQERPGPALAVAVTALVALQPMLAATGAAVGNDGLANLLGAALCWVWLRLLGRGATRRRIALALGLLALGLLTKRTLLPYAPFLTVSAVLALLRWGAAGRRQGAGDRGQETGDRTTVSSPDVSGLRSRVSALSIQFSALALGVAALMAWGASQFDWGTAWGWYWYGGHQPVARVRLAGAHSAALQVRAGQVAVYPLPAVAGDRLRHGTLRFGARVWSDGDAVGRLVVLRDGSQHEIRFDAHHVPARVETSASVYGETRSVALALAADRGTLYAADIWAESGDVPLIANRALELPGLREGALLAQALRYLRLQDVAWALAAGQVGRPLPERWGALLFASFWGHFGWMSVSFVLGSPWAWALGGFCLAGALGLPLALARVPPGRARRQLWALLGVCAAALLLPLIHAYAMPAYQALQQGRYLFPALVPLALLAAAGQRALVPARLQWVWLAAWLVLLGALAASALARVESYY